ncbi:Ankyrin repeat and LEM domain-containing protein 1 [Eumeta japonica]|uniref:Ankyrin repeat and LEM domain-containing protein 1 n=1 Tax=Eumeta variegata TaxID=151549 RepID=A0A4C1TU27_EUMVA|nr:Ankyrin repeat and LEM domain-containing protein 1 [Eumeta japonica]
MTKKPQRSEDGITPLHIAAIWGRLDNLKLLVGCGGDPSNRDADNHSVFDYAAREQQWEVYDYLHNVIDLQDDSLGSPCAYSLDLEKVIVRTDHLVAEYGLLTDEKVKDVMECRRSEMVRDWCDKATLSINRLYPTILSEKTFLDDESVPWQTDDFTQNNAKNSSSDNTQTSYKSCFSRVVPSVVQNRTNEWISNSSRSGSITSIKDTNTNCRKSSTTSGVNSSFSGGSIALANVEEEYKYEDKEEDVVLIEKRLLVSSIVLPIEETESKSSNPENTILTVASSLPASMEYDNNRLRAELIQLGFNPGPIDNKTRTLYLKKLHSLKKEISYKKCTKQKNYMLCFLKQNLFLSPKKSLLHPFIQAYSIELEKSLRNDAWLKDLSNFMQLDEKVRADFASPGKRWREGTSKTSFTYLLLDPRVTNNLPAKATQCSQHACWITFVNSIFYVGKGKRSRPYSHLYQALTLWKRDFKTSNDKKIQYILDIWSEKVGVVCLHIFQNVIPAEAYTYEAAMIDVLGVNNLKNMKTGNYYGITASWPMKDRRMFGLYLLYKAMLIFGRGEWATGTLTHCTKCDDRSTSRPYCVKVSYFTIRTGPFCAAAKLATAWFYHSLIWIEPFSVFTERPNVPSLTVPKRERNANTKQWKRIGKKKEHTRRSGLVSLTAGAPSSFLVLVQSPITDLIKAEITKSTRELTQCPGAIIYNA